MKKNTLLIILIIIAALCLLCGTAMADSEDMEWECGESIFPLMKVKATLSGDTLTISGAGTMNTSPWYDQRSSIKKVVINIGITSIGDYAFRNCTNLTSVSISNTVKSIGHEAFRGCSSLTTLTIPNSVNSIGQSEFASCSGLTELILSDNLTEIPFRAFSNCSNLQSITIPAGVTSIDGSAFIYCPALTSVAVSKNNSNFVAEGEFLYNGDKTILVRYFGHDKSLTIPDTVTEIGVSALELSGVQEIKWPSNLTTIGERAFEYSELYEVTIPASVTLIETHAFKEIQSLQKVEFLGSNFTFGGYIFERCQNLKNIWFPGTEEQWQEKIRNYRSIFRFTYNPPTVHCHRAITYANAEHGTISGEAIAYDGSTVTVTVTPDENYLLETLTYTDGDTEKTISEENGIYTFTVPVNDTTVTATFIAKPQEQSQEQQSQEQGEQGEQGQQGEQGEQGQSTDPQIVEQKMNLKLKKLKATASGAKAIKLSWTKLKKKDQKKVGKFVIEVSTDKKFAKDVITKTVSAKKNSVTIKKLKPGKKYYIRIRAIKEEGNIRYVTKWFKKNITLKKK